VVAFAVVATGVAIGLSGWGDEDAVAVVAPTFEVVGDGDAAAIVPAHGFRAGEALVPALEVFAAPGAAPGTPAMSVSANPTWEGFPLVMSIIGQSDDGAWLNVRLPQRPNGYSGWVRASEVRAWDVPNRIQVSVSTNTLRVFEGDSEHVLLEATVGVGRGRTPTPLGDFFIDIVNPLGGHATYGWGQLSVSGFSEVHQTFGGGIGQIALHGWNNPATVLGDVSNGCVRMINDDIARVAELSPLGTPVQIVA